MIEAVIFDMDGLLIDSEPYWQKTERVMMKKLGVDLTEEMQKETFGLSSQELIQNWYNYKPWPNPDFIEQEKSYDEMMLHYFKTEAELLPGAEYILNFIKKKNLKTALASSSNMSLINAFINRFNLSDFFQVTHSAEFENFAKPHPAVYLGAAKKLNMNPLNCLAFEDSIHGVISAKAARIKVVAVPEKSRYKLPEYAVANLKISNLKEFGEKEFKSINNS